MGNSCKNHGFPTRIFHQMLVVGIRATPSLPHTMDPFSVPCLNDASDAATAGPDPCNLEVNFRQVPGFDLLYQSFSNSDTDSFNSESVAGWT